MVTPAKWGDEFLVNTKTKDWQFAPEATVLADGRFVVVWTDANDYSLRAQLYNADGGEAGGEFLVGNHVSITAPESAVAALPGGGYVVAWTSHAHRSGRIVKAEVFNADGSKFAKEFLVNTTTEDNQDHPVITALADGRFVVAWTDGSETGGDTSGDAVRAQIFKANGKESGEEFLVNTGVDGDQSEATVTALTNGRFVVGWTDEGSGYAVRAQIFDANGNKFGDELHVNTTLGFDPTIAALADGRFIVAWESSDIRAQIFNANGSALGSEFLVSTPGDLPLSPTITRLADGRFVVAWDDWSGSGGDESRAAVHAQVLNADGSKSGDEFLVNTTTKNFQGEPSITALPDGRFIVAWRDSSQTGGDKSDAAVRGQIFDPREEAINLQGGNLGEQFIGTAFDDTINGRGGKDWLRGEKGSDSLNGGKGGDLLNGGGGSDFLAGGEHLCCSPRSKPASSLLTTIS